MADKKISDLADGGAPQDPDEFVVARGGDNFKLAWSSLSASNQIAVTASGNTAGVLAGISTGTLTLAGGNNITLSQVGNAVTISGANAGGAQTGISGISASDTLYTSGTVKITGVGGGVTVSSNTGQRVDISVAAPVAQSEQTQNVIDLTLSGNTAGVPDLVSSGTLTLAGGNNITVSQAGNAITISGPNIPAESQTFIAAISASDTVYTSGSVRISGSGAATVRSGTGQLVVVDVATQSVQPETQTFVGGVIASNTTYTSGSVRITGVGGGVTVSSNTGQRVDISVAAQSVQPETQTFIAGVSASDTLYTSGNVRITGVGGGITVSTNTGQRIDLSVAAQSVQPETQTFVGGIKNSQTTYTSGTIGLSELGAVTIRSTTGNQFQISVNSQSVQAETQTFVGGIQNSQTTYTSGTVNLSVVAGNLTIRSTTGQAFQFSMSQTVQAETQTAISGIANSQTTYTSGTVSLSELGAITIRSTTGNQFQLSVNSQTAQTQGILAVGASTGGNTSGDTGVASGTRLVFVGSNNITISQGTAANATTLTISGPSVAGAQTAISGLANSQTTYTSGTVSLSELGAITIRSTTGNQFQFSVNSQTVQTQNMVALSATNTLYSSGTVLLTGSNMITVKSSGAGQTIVLDATQSVQTQDVLSVGASTGGNTAGNTQVSTGSRLVFVGSNNITVSQGTAAGATTLTLSGPATSAQQTGISAISNSNTTYTSGTIGISELGAITIRSTTGNQFQFSVNSQSAQTQSLIAGIYDGAASISTGTVRLTNANGVTFTINAQTLSASVNQSISMFAVSNTTQNTSGTAHKSALSFGGAGIASVGVTGGSVVISVPSGGGAGDGGVFAGISTMGNTAGSTGTVSTGNVVLVGTGPISLSQSTGAAGSAATISINAPATSSLSGTGGISISTTGSTISLGFASQLADWENMPMGQAQLETHVSAISKKPIYWNDSIGGNLTANSLGLKISMVTASQPLSVSVHLGVYTLVNSTSAALLGSHSEAFVVSSASSVSLSGVRYLILTGIGTHATLSTISGGQYMLGLMFSATATNAMNFSIYGASTAGGPLGGLYPGTNNLSTGTSQGLQALAGRGSVTVNAMPANVVASDVVNYGQGASMQLHPWVYIRS